jgi:hypothetical protein
MRLRGWTEALVPVDIVVFISAPILLIIGLVRWVRRRDPSGAASLAAVALPLFVFSIVTGAFVIDVSYAAEC